MVVVTSEDVKSCFEVARIIHFSGHGVSSPALADGQPLPHATSDNLVSTSPAMCGSEQVLAK